MDIDFTPEGEYVVRISNSENAGNIDEIYIISHESQKLLAHISGGKAYNSNSNTIIIEDCKGNLWLAMKYHPDEIVKMGRATLSSYYMNHK